MFEGFARVWTPVVLARHLKAAPLRVLLAGEPVVLFRGAGGLGALIDRCPHRGAQLSLGRVNAEGCLECPFHAWHFDTTGAVTHVPLNPKARRELLFATRLPVRELAGLIWVYTAPGEAPQEPQPPDGLVREDLTRTFLQLDWACHWTRAMENMVDAPHVPYVHRTTIGRADQKSLRRDSQMEIAFEPTAFGARSSNSIDGVDRGASLDFYKPNIMSLTIPIPGKVFRIQAVCVPQGPAQTRMIIVGSRNFASARVLNPFFNFANRVIAMQDKAVVESSSPVQVPPPGSELSVETDRMTLHFRRYFFEALASSSVEHPARR